MKKKVHDDPEVTNMAGDLNEFLKCHIDSAGRYQSELDRIFKKYEEIDNIREEDLGSVLDISNLQVIKEQDGDFKKFQQFGKSRKGKPKHYERRDLQLDSNQNVTATFDRKYFQETEFDNLQDISHCVASYLQREGVEGEPSDAETLSSFSSSSSESVYTDCLEESPSSEYELSPQSNPVSPGKASGQDEDSASEDWDVIKDKRNSRSTLKQKPIMPVKYQSDKITSQACSEDMNQTYTIEQLSKSPHSIRSTKKEGPMKRIETDFIPLRPVELQKETYKKNDRTKYLGRYHEPHQRGTTSDAEGNNVVGNHKFMISNNIIISSNKSEERAGPFHHLGHQREEIREDSSKYVGRLFHHPSQDSQKKVNDFGHFPGTPKSNRRHFEDHSETPDRLDKHSLEIHPETPVHRSSSLQRVQLKSPAFDLSPSQRKFGVNITPKSDKFRTPTHYKHTKLTPGRHDSPKHADTKSSGLNQSNSTHVDSGFSTLHEDPSNLENESNEREVSKLSVKNVKAFNESFTENASLINVTNWIKSPDKTVVESTEKNVQINGWLQQLKSDKRDEDYRVENPFSAQSSHNFQRLVTESKDKIVQFEEVEHHKIPFSPGKKKSPFFSESRKCVLRSPEEELNRSIDNQNSRQSLQSARAKIHQDRPVIKKCVRKLNVAKAFEELKHLNAGDLLMGEGQDDRSSLKTESIRSSNKYYTPGKRCINEIDRSPKMDLLTKDITTSDYIPFPSKCRKLQGNSHTSSKSKFTGLDDFHSRETYDIQHGLSGGPLSRTYKEEESYLQQLLGEISDQDRHRSRGTVNPFDVRQVQKPDNHEQDCELLNRIQTNSLPQNRYRCEQLTLRKNHQYPLQENKDVLHLQASRSASPDNCYDRSRKHSAETQFSEALFRQNIEHPYRSRYNVDIHRGHHESTRKSLGQSKDDYFEENSEDETDNVRENSADVLQKYYSRGETHQMLLSPKQKHDKYRYRHDDLDFAERYEEHKQDVDRFFQIRDEFSHYYNGNHHHKENRNRLETNEMPTHNVVRKSRSNYAGSDYVNDPDLTNDRFHHSQETEVDSYSSRNSQITEILRTPSQKSVSRLNEFSPSTSLAQLQLNTPNSSRRNNPQGLVNRQPSSAVRKSIPRVAETSSRSLSDVRTFSRVQEHKNNSNSRSNITKCSLKSLSKEDLDTLQYGMMEKFRPKDREQKFRGNLHQLDEPHENFEKEFEDQAAGRGEFISLDKLASYSNQIKVSHGQLRDHRYSIDGREEIGYADQCSSENEDASTIYTDELTVDDMQPYKIYYNKIVEKDLEQGNEKENFQRINSNQDHNLTLSNSPRPRMKKSLFASKVTLSPCNAQKGNLKQLLPQSRSQSINSKIVLANQSPLTGKKSEIITRKAESGVLSKSVALKQMNGRHFLQSTPIKKENRLQFNDTMSTIMGSDEPGGAEEEEIILLNSD